MSMRGQCCKNYIRGRTVMGEVVMRGCCYIVGGIALWFGCASWVQAGPIRPARELSRDVLQTMQARELLHTDPDLRGLNIGVAVENRVATLFGPVPTAEVMLRAELCLRTMIGL